MQILVLIGFLISSPALGDVFPFDHLSKYRTDLEDMYPPTLCGVKALLGREYEAFQERAYQGGLSGRQDDWEKAPAEEGAVFSVIRHYQNEGGYILWIHKSGDIVMGIRSKKIIFYTNNTKYKTKVPVAVKNWGEDQKATWKWADVKTLPANCHADQMKDEVETYVAIRNGEICDVKKLHYLTFSQRPTLVKEKATLFSSPSDSPSGKQPYVVAGDMVQLLKTDFKVTEKSGRHCAYYRSVKGKERMGWIDAKLLREFTDEEAPEAEGWMKDLTPLQWFPRSYNRINFPGKYKRDQMKIANTIETDPSKGGVSIKFMGGVIDDGRVFDKSSFTASIKNSRVARYVETFEGEPSQEAAFYLFNNGIYAHFQSATALHSWGIYYPK